MQFIFQLSGLYCQLFSVPNYKLFHVYDCHSHTKPATRLRSKNVGIAVKSSERATDRSGRGWSFVIVRAKSVVHVQKCLRSVCDHKTQTCLTWSYHQSCVIAPPLVRGRTTSGSWLGVKQSHDQKFDQSQAVPTGCTTKRWCFTRSPFTIARHDWWYV